MELFEQIRKDYFNNKTSIRSIARSYGIHRRQVRQALNNAIPPKRKASKRICTVLLRGYKQQIEQWISDDIKSPPKQRHTGRRIYERLLEEHNYLGAEVTVCNYVYQKRKELGVATKAYIPQMHIAGEEAEVDWYEALANFPHGNEKVYIFQMRACFSGREFHKTFSHQNQQSFLEGHIAAFNYFGGVFKNIRYDNLTSAVKKVLRGRKRIETERFILLRSHYLFESIFCLPGIRGAHEKGGVEGGVGRFRRSHLVPIPQVHDIDELNRLLLSGCKKDDKRIIIGKSQSVAEAWQIEAQELLPLPKEAFAAADITTPKVNHKSLIAVKGNYYSVPVNYVGQSVEAQINSEKIIIMKRGKIIVEHLRNYGQHQIIAKLSHYLPLLRYRPGALPGSIALHQARQNGKWSNTFEQYWQALIHKYGQHDANKQLVELLWWARDYAGETIEKLIIQAMQLGCYQLESIKVLMRHQTSSNEYIPLNENLLGDLIAYDRPKSDVTDYDLLLGAKT